MLPPDLPGLAETLDPRRGFLTKGIALLSGVVAYVAPAVAGVFTFLNPLRQKSQTGRLFRLTSLDSLIVGGPPQKFPVVADRTDAWNRFPKEPIGSVYLRRIDERQVEAINVVCPHQGCSIQYAKEGNKFFCPCHQASFDLAGRRADEKSASPRDLDALEVDQQRLQEGEVWVKFENFCTGIPDKVPEA